MARYERAGREIETSVPSEAVQLRAEGWREIRGAEETADATEQVAADVASHDAATEDTDDEPDGSEAPKRTRRRK